MCTVIIRIHSTPELTVSFYWRNTPFLSLSASYYYFESNNKKTLFFLLIKSQFYYCSNYLSSFAINPSSPASLYFRGAPICDTYLPPALTIFFFSSMSLQKRCSLVLLLVLAIGISSTCHVLFVPERQVDKPSWYRFPLSRSRASLPFPQCLR